MGESSVTFPLSSSKSILSDRTIRQGSRALPAESSPASFACRGLYTGGRRAATRAGALMAALWGIAPQGALMTANSTDGARTAAWSCSGKAPPSSVLSSRRPSGRHLHGAPSKRRAEKCAAFALPGLSTRSRTVPTLASSDPSLGCQVCLPSQGESEAGRAGD